MQTYVSGKIYQAVHVGWKMGDHDKTSVESHYVSQLTEAYP